MNINSMKIFLVIDFSSLENIAHHRTSLWDSWY